MRWLLPVVLCFACSDTTVAPEDELARWFERVELEGRSDAPEVVIAWDGMGPTRSRLVDSVQFAVWSDGHAVWREGDLLEASGHREFRCTEEELSGLRAVLAAQLSGPFRWGPQAPSAGSQLILWRERQSIRGVLTDAFLDSLDLDGSTFGRIGEPPQPRADWEREAGWARLTQPDRDAVRARSAIEAAVSELVARHPEAQPTSALRLLAR